MVAVAETSLVVVAMVDTAKVAMLMFNVRFAISMVMTHEATYRYQRHNDDYLPS